MGSLLVRRRLTSRGSRADVKCKVRGPDGAKRNPGRCLRIPLRSLRAAEATIAGAAHRAKHEHWVNQPAPKYSALPKFGFDVCIADPDPAKRGGRTSSRAADRAAVDVGGAVADVSGRAGQWIEPSLVSTSQAASDERRRVRPSPLGEAGSACVRQNRVVLAVVATVKSCGCGIGANRRGAGDFRKAREARRNSAPGRARHKPSDHRAGKAVCSATPVCCCAVSLRYVFAQQTVGARSAPGLPCALLSRA